MSVLWLLLLHTLHTKNTRRVAYPGCNAIWPCCGQVSAGTLSLRVQQLDVRCETKTKDNVFVSGHAPSLSCVSPYLVYRTCLGACLGCHKRVLVEQRSRRGLF